MEALKKNHQKIISLKQAKKIIIILVFILCFDFLLSSTPAMANESVTIFSGSQDQINIVNLDTASEVNQAGSVNAPELNGKLPENGNASIKWSKYFVVTAYTSEVGQTDDSPCITANNFNVCDNGTEDTIAANFLPFGAKVKIPELFGDRIFIVRDRMNRRFDHRIDVWMVEKPDAVNFGVKLAKIEILK